MVHLHSANQKSNSAMMLSEFHDGSERQQSVSNLALVKAVKDCALLWDSRLAKYKDMKKRKLNG